MSTKNFILMLLKTTTEQIQNKENDTKKSFDLREIKHWMKLTDHTTELTTDSAALFILNYQHPVLYEWKVR